MKLNGNKKSKLGIAMTEYLIILAVVAIAAIAVTGLFGKQVKSVFNACTSAMSGGTVANASCANSGLVTSDTMGTFPGKPASSSTPAPAPAQ